MLRREVEAALQEFETATMLNPSFAVGHYSVGFAQSAAGKNAVSDVSVTRAHRLSPYDPMRFAMLATRAINAAALCLHDHAADLAQLAAAQPNAHHHIIATAAVCHALAGRQDAAENTPGACTPSTRPTAAPIFSAHFLLNKACKRCFGKVLDCSACLSTRVTRDLTGTFRPQWRCSDIAKITRDCCGA
jgi:hypothetical protein